MGSHSTDGLHISDLIDIEVLQALMEKFSLATSTPTALLDPMGNVLVATGWRDICTQFHRVNPETSKRCLESDVTLANSLAKGKKYNIYRCKNGLVDVAIPIYIKGVHFANLFIGQFLTDKPDVDFFRQQAREYGFKEDDYLQALSRVPILSEQDVRLKLDYLSAFAVFLAEAGLNKIERIKVMESLEERVEERTRDLKEAQATAQKLMIEAQEAYRQAQKAKEKLEETLTELERSNRELQHFAYVASHDLQEPLRMVSSYVQLLQRRYQDKLDDDANEFIGFAVDGAARMKRLIQDLLTYSRVTTRGGKMETFDSGTALDQALQNLQTLLQENQAEVNRGELPQVTADPGQLAQVFQNLVQNAVKFRGAETPRIEVAATRGEDGWVFSVSDNGVGIEPQYFDRIFIIYQRLVSKAELGGTGIGLALVKKIVARHGGRIWVESTPGKGSTFYFNLPERRKKP